MSDTGGRGILMLSCQMMPEVFGGAEQQCLRLSRALRAMGERPQILTSVSTDGIPEYENVDGVPITRLRVPSPPQMGGRRILSSVKWMLAAQKWITQHAGEISLIHCHQAKLNAWVGVRAAKRLGVPSLVKLGTAGQNLDFYSLERKKFVWGKVAAQEIARDATRIVSISKEMYDDTRAFGIPEPRCQLIPNGVEPVTPITAEERASLRAELGVLPGERLLLFVGRMERQKNVETLLTALSQIPYDRFPTRLAMLGDGALLDVHRDMARSVGLGGRAVFVGRVSDVGRYLGASDLLVLPALAEGMSNALLEAMAAGVPQVASSVSGNTDLIVQGETGWLYGAPRDADALRAKIETALSMKDAALDNVGASAQHRVQEFYSIEAVARRYLALYDDLLSETQIHAVA
ncbi:MAG: hypothetical protein CMH12_18460 [Maritimibacter sp.]|nr:hypothetical protein [Maritimibacter sp.]